MSAFCFELIAQTHEDFQNLFEIEFPLQVILEKKKLNVGKVVDKMTLRSYIPTDSVKSRDGNYFSPFYNNETGVYVGSDKTNLIYLVSYSYVMPGW